jgi:hypothetical protein
MIRQQLTTALEIFEIPNDLVFVPSVQCVISDLDQVGFGSTLEAKRGHGLRP